MNGTGGMTNQAALFVFRGSRTALQAQLLVHTFDAVLQAENVATAMLSAAMRQYASRMFLNDANTIEGAADIRRSLLSR